jgi:DNA invertase Pin-like site-specific DNA recombinase
MKTRARTVTTSTTASYQTNIAASYERVSTVAQAEFGYGLKVSGRDVDDMAREHGLDLPQEFRFIDGVDQNASGTDWTLPALNAMLDLAKAKRFTTLLVPATDRFTRDTPKGLTLTAQLASYGVRVIWGNLPQIEDTDGHPMKRYIRRRMESDAFQLAELEREMITFRTARARHAKAKDGRVVGNGPPPFGYEYRRADDQKHKVNGLVEVAQEALIVRQLFERARTASTTRLQRWLDSQNIPTPRQMRGLRGAPSGGWNYGTIAEILNNAVYVGCYRYGDQEIAVPPLVDRATFDAVQKGLALRYRRPSGWWKKKLEREDPFVLRGLLECGHCSKPGQPQILHAQEKVVARRRYYWCANKFASRVKDGQQTCPLPGIRAEVLEDWLWHAVVSAIANVDEFDASLQASQERRDAELHERADRLAAIDQEVARYQRRLDRAVAKLLDDDFEDEDERGSVERNRDDSKRLLARLRADREREVAETRPAGLSAEDVIAFRQLLRHLNTDGLDKATPSERREVLELLGIRGVVRVASDGADAVLVQESPQRWARIDWDGEIRLQSEQSFKKLRLVCNPTPRFVLLAA